MNKRNKIFITVIAVLVISIIAGIIILERISKSSMQKQEIFAGNGELRQAKRLNGLGAIYNDDYIFFDSEEQVYTSINVSDTQSQSKLRINCRNSACSHSDDSCEAYVEMGEYFVFNNKLYKCYNEKKMVSGEGKFYGYIEDMQSGEKVFSNTIPKDISPELAVDDSESILYVRVLSDDIIKIDGDRHAYLLDKDFNVIYCHYNIGKFPWGAVFNNSYYYVNDIYQMIKVDLNTLDSEVLDLEGKVFMGDSDENNIYYSNEFSELYKMSVEDGSVTKIAEDVLMFSVQDKYLYTSGGEGGNKKILDKQGKEIADYTNCENMGSDEVFQIGDRIYTIFEGGVAYMDLDGKNYGEITK